MERSDRSLPGCGSAPLFGGAAWDVTNFNSTAFPVTVTAYAICAVAE